MFFQQAPALHHKADVIQFHNCQQDGTPGFSLQLQAMKYQNRATAVARGGEKIGWLQWKLKSDVSSPAR